MDSVVSLSSPLYGKKTERSETLVTMVGSSFQVPKRKDSPDLDVNVEHFKRGRHNMSVRGPKSSDKELGRGSVRRSVKNFEMLLNGTNPETKEDNTENLNPVKPKSEVKKFTKYQDTFLAKFSRKKDKISTVDETRETKLGDSDCHENYIKYDDVAEGLYDDISFEGPPNPLEEVRREVADASTSTGKENLDKVIYASEKNYMCTQTTAREMKRKAPLIPLSALNAIDRGDLISSFPQPDLMDAVNPMHVVTLNPKPNKKNKNGSNPPRVVKRRMSVSGDEQTEKFSRLTRFGSGLRKKLSASTKDLFGSVTSSSSPPTSPKDDVASISGSTRGFKRNLSSSMRDLFGGSFSMKGEKDIRERFGKSEERRKDNSYRNSAFLIGGGITIGRSAGRSRGNFRDSFRDMLPKLRMTRVFEVNVVLPDGTETSVSKNYILS